VPRSPHSSIVIGYERLARRLRDRGHHFEILGPEDLRPGTFDARFLPLIFPLIVRRWLSARRDLDLVIFHSYTGWLARRPRPSCRMAVAFHGFEPLYHEAHDAEARRGGTPLSRRYRSLYGALMPRMLRRACRRADLVICLNSDEKAAIVDRGYAPASKVWIGRHGAPPWFFAPHDYRARAATIISVMQWLPSKGVRSLAEAFTALARRHPDLRLIAAGTLQPEEVVRASFPADVRDRVEVHPVFDQREHAALLARADLFLHPSVYEAFGLAIVEAMASGLPIVTTRTGVAIDHLTDGRDALIVPIADARAIEAVIEPLLDDAARRAALGRAAQARAKTLDEDGAIDDLASVLERTAVQA
jgi:glycosyltransferase involved in cell wall biosynthesis